VLHERSSQRVSTGLDALDAVLGGLYWGDNVVWECSGVSPAPFYHAIASSGERFDSRNWVSLDADAEAGSGERDAVALLADVHRLCELRGRRRLLLFDGLERMVAAWGPGGARGFFARCCPFLLEAGAIAYWSLDMEQTPPMVRGVVEGITQCVLRVEERKLTVIKAEGRDERVKGSVLHWHLENGQPVLAPADLLGRIAASLRGIRRARSLSQHDLAELAGVTASAISQAERGERGLSLATLLRLSGALEIKLDDLLRGEAPDSYRIGRLSVNLGGDGAQLATLLAGGPDEPRVELVRLAEHRGAPAPAGMRGQALVAVAEGLVQVLIDPHAPVLRPGEVVVTDAAHVRGWRNLGRAEAMLFWIVLPPARGR
jgi:transcriptional regulator with XRE-family HTH domain